MPARLARCKDPGDGSQTVPAAESVSKPLPRKSAQPIIKLPYPAGGGGVGEREPFMAGTTVFPGRGALSVMNG